ncbi:hypothetical protein B9Z55_000604 [Caenorhabditis nigoni]|uniref:Uncharacterized protein n=1 Tax=Caenorhabditis nigoni TaxID=1611254 RepID=A0A2G5VUE3_9PELO|nr:hypothetical protein B9Z55_000604 [Caenorhabditis nigoni]
MEYLVSRNDASVNCSCGIWSQSIRKNFHWCHRGYPQISDVFISKIKDFYLKQQEKLDESVKKYAEYAESRTAPNLPPH